LEIVKLEGDFLTGMVRDQEKRRVGALISSNHRRPVACDKQSTGHTGQIDPLF
jgi:hypothetical protein